MSQLAFTYYKLNIISYLNKMALDLTGSGTMLQRLCCLVMLNVSVFYTCSLFADPHTEIKQPNIIIILADDLGAGDLSMNGSVIRTPNIDKLAKEGVTLTDFYASANVCTPSRAGLLTGRYAIRSGLADNVIESDSSHGLPRSEETLAELLKRQGYDNALIGKWHLGHTEEHWPTEHGFDSFFGLLYSNDMQPLRLYSNRAVLKKTVDQTQLTNLYTRKTIKFIKEKRKQPFFIYLSHTFPHIPLYASEAFRGKSKAGIYGDAVEELDWSVGEIIKTLKSENLDKNTLVLFTSDNGAWFEGSNAGQRGMKGMSWDGGFRVPLIARWPGKISPDSVSDGIAMNIDILPTLAGLTGAKMKANQIDGRNIWSLLQGENTSPHERLYLFNNEDIVAVRTQKWKYLARAYYKNRYIGFEGIKSKMGFDYQLLFDMSNRAAEQYSQASNQPEVLKQMLTLLENGREEFESMRTRPAAEVFP